MSRDKLKSDAELGAYPQDDAPFHNPSGHGTIKAGAPFCEHAMSVEEPRQDCREGVMPCEGCRNRECVIADLTAEAKELRAQLAAEVKRREEVERYALQIAADLNTALSEDDDDLKAAESALAEAERRGMEKAAKMAYSEVMEATECVDAAIRVRDGIRAEMEKGDKG
jgi:hypothetical protein